MLLRTFKLLVFDFLIIDFRNVPTNDHFRNASCALNYISTPLFHPSQKIGRPNNLKCLWGKKTIDLQDSARVNYA